MASEPTDKERFVCPLCETTEYRSVLDGHGPGGFELFQCAHCSFFFLNPANHQGRPGQELA